MAGTKLLVEASVSLIAETVLSAASTELNSLEGIAVSGLQDRATCYVRVIPTAPATDGVYRYFDTDVTVANGLTIVAPAVGAGRWRLESLGTGAGVGIGGSMNNFSPVNTPTSIPGDNTAAQIEYNNSEFSDAGMVDLVNDRLVVPVAGRYLITVWGFFESLPAGRPTLVINVGGAEFANAHADFTDITVTTLLQLAAGALITATASQGTGADLAINIRSRLGAQLVGLS